jgi:DNA-binding NarL/FixJ family response regulator
MDDAALGNPLTYHSISIHPLCGLLATLGGFLLCGLLSPQSCHVVEGEADMRELGFDNCDLAADGQQAFLHAMTNQPDVVLMDVNLEGDREGIEAAKSLREACDVPIVFVTGCTDRDTVARIHHVVPGAPVLPKPVWGDRLADAVAAVTTFRMW